MRGVARVITTTSLILIALAAMAIVFPVVVSMSTGLADALGYSTRYLNEYIQSDVVIYPPPAYNPLNVDQVLIIHNTGLTTLSNVKVLMIDDNGVSTELNFTILQTNGSFVSKRTLDSGEAVFATVPALTDYIGYSFVFISDQYSESVRVG